MRRRTTTGAQRVDPAVLTLGLSGFFVGGAGRRLMVIDWERICEDDSVEVKVDRLLAAVPSAGEKE